MTDQSPTLFPTVHVEPVEASHAVLPAASASKSSRSKALTKRPRRTGLWLAASDRWMNRSFDPVKAEAIRESYGSVPATGEAEEA